MFDNIQDKNQSNQVSTTAPNNNNSLADEKQPMPIANNNQSNVLLEDMFAETEKKEKPPVFQKKPEIDFDQTNRIETTDHGHQKLFFLIFLILILSLLGVGSFWGYRYFIDKFADNKNNIQPNNIPLTNENTTETPVQKNDTQEAVNNNEVLNENTTNIETDINAPQETNPDGVAQTENTEKIDDLLDSDNDGLTDSEEWQLGTAVDNVDTDNDGLFDREEVRVYKTNPKIADSDGDGYSDGDEVKGGYNPLGSGKLFDLNK